MAGKDAFCPMGSSTARHTAIWRDRVGKENDELARQMRMLYGRHGEKIRLEAGLRYPVGEVPWPEPHVRPSGRSARGAASADDDPGCLLERPFEFRGAALLSVHDPTLESIHGLGVDND